MNTGEATGFHGALLLVAVLVAAGAVWNYDASRQVYVNDSGERIQPGSNTSFTFGADPGKAERAHLHLDLGGEAKEDVGVYLNGRKAGQGEFDPALLEGENTLTLKMEEPFRSARIDRIEVTATSSSDVYALALLLGLSASMFAFSMARLEPDPRELVEAARDHRYQLLAMAAASAAAFIAFELFYIQLLATLALYTGYRVFQDSGIVETVRLMAPSVILPFTGFVAGLVTMRLGLPVGSTFLATSLLSVLASLVVPLYLVRGYRQGKTGRNSFLHRLAMVVSVEALVVIKLLSALAVFLLLVSLLQSGA